MLSAAMRVLSLLAIFTFITAADPAFATTKKQEGFWSWFQANEPRLYDVERDPGPVMADLIPALENVNELISFQFGPIGDDGRREFVLSANGHLGVFSAVEALHAAAPNLSRWTFVKFHQRKEFDAETTMAVSDGAVDGALKLGEVRYIMAADGTTAAIALFLPGADKLPDSAINELAWLVLQGALGEEDYARRVRNVSVLDVTHEFYDVSKPIAKLPAEFDTALKN